MYGPGENGEPELLVDPSELPKYQMDFMKGKDNQKAAAAREDTARIKTDADLVKSMATLKGTAIADLRKDQFDYENDRAEILADRDKLLDARRTRLESKDVENELGVKKPRTAEAIRADLAGYTEEIDPMFTQRLQDLAKRHNDYQISLRSRISAYTKRER